MINSMPAGIKGCVEDGGWTVVGHRNISRWRVITEDEYGEEFAAANLIETYKEMVQNVSNHFNRFGLDNDDANTFMTLFSSDAAEKICAHLSEQLVRDGKHPGQTIAELYEVIAMWLVRS